MRSPWILPLYAAAAGLLVAAGATAAGAQGSAGGSRWGGGVGIGATAVSVACTPCEAVPVSAGPTWQTSVSGSVAFATSPRLTLDLAGAGWYRARRTVAGEILNAVEGFALNAGARYRPIGGLGLFVRAGAGVGMTQRHGEGTDSLRWYDVGPSASLGGGYDFHVGRGWALVPYAAATGLVGFSLRSNVEHSSTPTWLELGIALEYKRKAASP